MNEMIVKTQKDLDKISTEKEVIIRIDGGTRFEKIIVSKKYYYRVEARGNSSVEARGNSSVVAWENSSVVARGNSSVEAWENSSVEAWGTVAVHLYSTSATVWLYFFAVCWKKAAGIINKKSKNAIVIVPKVKETNLGWFEKEGVKVENNKVILYKRVSKDFKTQEHTVNETTWKIGSEIEHGNWEPKTEECGPGKFHACSTAYFCDDFRSTPDDVYIAIEVSVKDVHAWFNGTYQHKIAFRKGKTLYQCTKFGKKI